MLTGQNGILNRTAEAKENTEIASKDEQRQLAQAEALMSTEKTTYKGVTLPEGFAPTKIEGEDSIDDGLVITDGYGNEYVWIEVPKTIYTDLKYNKDNTIITEKNTDKIKECLKEYTSEYTEDGYEDTSTEDYINMLESIYKNGGFWTGRYEAGLKGDTPRTDKNIPIQDSGSPVIKQNMIPYTGVTQNEAKTLAEEIKYDGYKTSLLYGIQWDLVLKFIEEKTVAAAKKSNEDIVRTQILKDLKDDSTKIGNYNDNLWKITNQKAKYLQDDGNIIEKCPYTKKESNNIILTTGADKSFSLINIYDLGGNVREWTLESEGNFCVNRGGESGTSGATHPIKQRGREGSTGSYIAIGFRIGLWEI